MKKILVFAICVLFLFTTFVTNASAHSGRTDANGGHYDHSTGEYHYHNGTSKGSSSSSSSSKIYSSSSSLNKGYSSGNYSSGNYSNKTVETSKEQELPGILRFLICVGAIAALGFLAFISYEKDQEALSNGDRRSLWGVLFYFSVLFLAIFIFAIFGNL